jgi:hypothetical protein
MSIDPVNRAAFDVLVLGVDTYALAPAFGSAPGRNLVLDQ